EVNSAITQLEKAAALNPKATAPLYLLAQAYRHKGDSQRAEELIARVSKMQADDREGLTRSDFKRLVPVGSVQ
ncbi:MAG: tetratricopeptide repeat protein, partial [Terriglobia bacterium]